MTILDENLFQNNDYNHSNLTSVDNLQTKSVAVASSSSSSTTTTTVATTPTIRSIDMQIKNHQQVQKQMKNPFEDNNDTSANLDNKELSSSQPKYKEQIVPSVMNPFEIENKKGEESSSQINGDPVHLSHSCNPSRLSEANHSKLTPKSCHEFKF